MDFLTTLSHLFFFLLSLFACLLFILSFSFILDAECIFKTNVDFYMMRSFSKLSFLRICFWTGLFCLFAIQVFPFYFCIFYACHSFCWMTTFSLNPHLVSITSNQVFLSEVLKGYALIILTGSFFLIFLPFILHLSFPIGMYLNILTPVCFQVSDFTFYFECSPKSSASFFSRSSISRWFLEYLATISDLLRFKDPVFIPESLQTIFQHPWQFYLPIFQGHNLSISSHFSHACISNISKIISIRFQASSLSVLSCLLSLLF